MIESKKNILVIGANGTIGKALVSKFQADPANKVFTLSREQTDYSETSLAEIAKQFKTQFKAGSQFQTIVCCIGVLHDDTVQPEKSLRQINADALQHYFYVNSVLPMLLIKHFAPLLDKNQPSKFACLSAMVGSSQDNALGGWYGYRASKAALNSLVKTASIELRRSNKNAALIAIHPGTTVGDLSAPFAKNVKPGKYYTPEQSAERINTVMQTVDSTQSGGFFNWDGSVIPW